MEVHNNGQNGLSIKGIKSNFQHLSLVSFGKKWGEGGHSCNNLSVKLSLGLCLDKSFYKDSHCNVKSYSKLFE